MCFDVHIIYVCVYIFCVYQRETKNNFRYFHSFYCCALVTHTATRSYIRTKKKRMLHTLKFGREGNDGMILEEANIHRQHHFCINFIDSCTCRKCAGQNLLTEQSFPVHAFIFDQEISIFNFLPAFYCLIFVSICAYYLSQFCPMFFFFYCCFHSFIHLM